jgi:uncharacterized membrane protein YebE (DUF533 family)
MRRGTLVYLLALSVLFNVGAVIATAYQVHRNTRAEPVNIAQSLQLDPEQARRWNEMETSFVAELDAEWLEIGRLRESLIRAIFAAQPDPHVIEVHRAAIAELQGRQQRRVIEQLLRERELLRPQQRQELIKLLLQHRQPTVEERQLHK